MPEAGRWLVLRCQVDATWLHAAEEAAVFALLAERAVRALGAAGGPEMINGVARAAQRLRAAGVEAAWLSVMVALYPWGLLPGRSPVRSLVHGRPAGRGTVARPRPPLRVDELPQRVHRLPVSSTSGPDPAGTSVLLVHGLLGNRSVFTLLAGALRRQHSGVVHALNHGLLTDDVRLAARRLAGQVEQLREQTGQQRVCIVGHSLGGLVARYYVQRLGGDAGVHTVITLGSPHLGTRMAHLLPPTRLARQLRPGSALLAELADRAPGCRTRFVAVWSRHDQFILPRFSARLEHPDLQIDTIEVPDGGHLSLVADPRAVRAVAQVLARCDSGVDAEHLRIAHQGPVARLRAAAS